MQNTDNDQRRVQVWFGTEVICTHTAEPAEADRYARLMGRRFAGLTVTIDTLPVSGDHGAPLPVEGLWELTVR